MDDFTVYYVVGQPRSGSTFVGDYIARMLEIVNAGEVWQTFRSVGLVIEPGFDSGQGRWARPEERATKNAEIANDPFWSQVLERAKSGDPYAALVAEAGARAKGLVDCSKTDRGLAHYQALGCRVVVIHSLRAFSSWSDSMRKYQVKQGLPVISRPRLLLSYLRFNRQMRTRWNAHGYRAVMQEELGQINNALQFPADAKGPKGQYLRAEMFGTPGFTGQFDPNRATHKITLFDRLCRALIGATSPRPDNRSDNS